MNSIFRYAIGLSVITLLGGLGTYPTYAQTISGSLAFQNGTDDFFFDVNPGTGDMFDVTFNLGSILFVSTATGDFVPPFVGAFTTEEVATSSATFSYVSGNSSEFIYELSNDLIFDFDNGDNDGNEAVITWLAGTRFEGMFNTRGVNGVEFNALDPQIVTVNNIGEDVIVIDSVLQFGDTQPTGGGSFLAAVDVAPVPEPLTILGAGTAIAFGTGFKRKLGKAKKK